MLDMSPGKILCVSAVTNLTVQFHRRGGQRHYNIRPTAPPFPHFAFARSTPFEHTLPSSGTHPPVLMPAVNCMPIAEDPNLKSSCLDINCVMNNCMHQYDSKRGHAITRASLCRSRCQISLSHFSSRLLYISTTTTTTTSSPSLSSTHTSILVISSSLLSQHNTFVSSTVL